jgi:phosphatidylglycerophosphatase A
MISLRSIIEQSTSNFEYLSDKIFEVHRVNDLKIKNETGVIMDDIIDGIYTFLIIYLCI